MRRWQRWIPAGLLALGVGVVQTVSRQHRMPLTTPLSAIPAEFEGVLSRDLPISAEEQRVAGMSSYLSRAYGPDSASTFLLYVGYYESQTQGRTIHSPKNCLPGAGWEPMWAGEIQLATDAGTVPVNRYVIANKGQRALVYYWYQGRGRVSANEYLVKWQLLRDASVRRRTDEALVRIVVPVRTTDADAEATDADAEATAQRVARLLVSAVGRIVPA